jgi:uncharacterized protein (DUF433 family)
MDYHGIITLEPGMSPAEIVDDFPALTEPDIYVCLSFAADKERQLEHLQAP